MPEISVVVPSVNGLEDLVGCLEALDAQRLDTDVEVVVVDRMGESVRAEVRKRFPWVELVEVPRDTTIPAMRAVGFRHATAQAVGVIEDHVLVRGGWARQMLAALADGAEVVGGSVENGATDTVVDWASFLCEYSHCLPPLPSGEVNWLTGNNVVYERGVLARHHEVIDEHRWENQLHDAIRADGTALVCHPEIIVDHKKHFTISEYLSARYQYSRSYAGARVDGRSNVHRGFYALATLALPPVLFYRTVKRILSKGRHRNWLIRSLPYLAIFVIAWAWGEIVGYVAGPGDSLSKVT